MVWVRIIVSSVVVNNKYVSRNYRGKTNGRWEKNKKTNERVRRRRGNIVTRAHMRPLLTFYAAVSIPYGKKDVCAPRLALCRVHTHAVYTETKQKPSTNSTFIFIFKKTTQNTNGPGRIESKIRTKFKRWRFLRFFSLSRPHQTSPFRNRTVRFHRHSFSNRIWRNADVLRYFGRLFPKFSS